MAQITIEYDGRDVLVKKAIDLLLSMKSVKIQSGSKLAKSIKDAKKSGYVSYDDFDDFEKAIKKELQNV